MAPWCAEENVPTSANLNYYGCSRSCVRWHRDDEALFGGQGESKLIVSVSVGFSALFRWEPRPSPDYEADSTWLHHGDLLDMDGRCQDEYLHSTDPKLQGERVNITFRWIKNHLPQCLVGAGVVCCLPTCVRGSPVSAGTGMEWPVLDFWGFLLILLELGLLVLAILILVGFWQQKCVEFWFSLFGLFRNQHSLCCSARRLSGTRVGHFKIWGLWDGVLKVPLTLAKIGQPSPFSDDTLLVCKLRGALRGNEQADKN